MTKARQSGTKPVRCVHMWLRPVAYGAAAAAAIAALFQPIPALAAPGAPAQPPAAAPAIPDSGSRPAPLGTVVLPGSAPISTPTAAAATTVASNPIVRLIEQGRTEVATLGDQLIRVGQDRDLAQQQLTVAQAQLSTAQSALLQADVDAAAASSDAM